MRVGRYIVKTLKTIQQMHLLLNLTTIKRSLCLILNNNIKITSVIQVSITFLLVSILL